MSYIAPWMAAGGHFPSHLLGSQHTLHPQHIPSSAHLPLSPESHIYDGLSPKNLSNHHANNEGKPEVQHQMPTQVSPSSSQASPLSSHNINSANNHIPTEAKQPDLHSVTASPSTTPSAHQNNNDSMESHYEPQGFHKNQQMSPPLNKYHHPDARHHNLAAHLHNLPELTLGLPGSSATSSEIRAHKKYVRSLVGPRSPGKHPPPEQLTVPVMYSYQGRGRPRKHWSHNSSLPSMLPITHPSPSNQTEDDEENKPFKCTVCNKGFKLRSGLQQHERTHSSDRPYVCPDCGKLFRQPTHLQQHMRIHTGEKPYDCTFCDKSFRQRTILNQHLRIHTGEKPYVCMECGKQFRQKAILDQHYRTHLGDKPFACPHPACRKHFREMATLISHMKCHKDVPDPKMVLQQAKKMIKEEHDEFGSTEANRLGVENLSRHANIPGLHGLQNHDSSSVLSHHAQAAGAAQSLLSLGQNGNITNGPQNGGSNEPSMEEQHRNQIIEINNSRYHLDGGVRPYSSPNSNSQKSSHPILSPAHSHNSHNGNTSNETIDHNSLTLGNASTQGGAMMAVSSPHMTMANLIPYTHSIFPAAAASYMMNNSVSDHRNYNHQLIVQGTEARQSH